jgi:uncharacterized protein DUF3574
MAVGARRSAVGVFVFLLVSCASMQLQEVQDVHTLYFGTARPGGVVSDAEWSAFVEEVITPEFPGFTEWKAMGHWKGVAEDTHVVQIAHLSRRESDQRIIRIIEEYKTRFDQEAVLWIRAPGLVTAK